MKNKLLSGTACAALCLLAFGGPARSATLDDVMARLDKIEKENAELRAEGSQSSRRQGQRLLRPRRRRRLPIQANSRATRFCTPRSRRRQRRHPCRLVRPSAAFRSKRVRSDRSSTTPPSRSTDRSTCPGTSSIHRSSIRARNSESRATFPVSAFGSGITWRRMAGTAWRSWPNWNPKSISRQPRPSAPHSGRATASWVWKVRGAPSRPANPIRPTRKPPPRWIRSRERSAITIRSWAIPAATIAPSSIGA